MGQHRLSQLSGGAFLHNAAIVSLQFLPSMLHVQPSTQFGTKYIRIGSRTHYALCITCFLCVRFLCKLPHTKTIVVRIYPVTYYLSAAICNNLSVLLFLAYLLGYCIHSATFKESHNLLLYFRTAFHYIGFRKLSLNV